MGAPIDFYFDFSSPYGYFAGAKIDALAKRYGRTVLWRPFLLGVVFKTTGNAPLTDQPLKGKYARRDFLRCAAYYGVPFKMPSTFPIATLAPARAVYWAEAINRPKASLLAKALFHAYFAEDRDIADASVTAQVAAGVGFDQAQAAAALQDPAIKERLRQETQAAIDRGVFGSPFIIVDGEPFWGVDRLEQVERWLKTGGW